MNLYEAIRLKALRDVIKGDSPDYALRKVFRWYSKTFHTPLHEVEDLPTEYVLQTYWESQYEELEDQKIDQEVVELTKTDEERKAEDRAWDEQQAEEVEFARMVGEKKPPAPKMEDLKPEPIKALVQDEPPKDVKAVEKAVDGVQNLSEALSKIKEFPPDVRMTFVTEEDMEALLEEDSIMPPVKPK